MSRISSLLYEAFEHYHLKPRRPFKRTLKRKEGKDVVYQKVSVLFKTGSGLFNLTGSKVSSELHRLKRNSMNNNNMLKFP
jgi:hypothetical protein